MELNNVDSKIIYREITGKIAAVVTGINGENQSPCTDVSHSVKASGIWKVTPVSAVCIT